MGSCCGNTLFEFQNFTKVLKNAPKVGKNIKLIYMHFEVDEYSTQIIRQRYPDFNQQTTSQYSVLIQNQQTFTLFHRNGHLITNQLKISEHLSKQVQSFLQSTMNQPKMKNYIYFPEPQTTLQNKRKLFQVILGTLISLDIKLNYPKGKLGVYFNDWKLWEQNRDTEKRMVQYVERVYNENRMLTSGQL